MSVLPTRLTELREAQGLGMQDVADHLGTSREAVRRWERGIYQIPDGRKVELARLLGVTVGQLMGCRREDCGLDGDCEQ